MERPRDNEMAHQSRTERLAIAAEEFNRHENRDDGASVAESLWTGLGILSKSLYARMHEDVEKELGRDSMLMPVSEVKAMRRTIEEIDVFQAAESTVAAAARGYVSQPETWYPRWLLQLKTDEAGTSEAIEQVANYISLSPDERRLAFTDVLSRVLAESRRAPLVLFRLAPLAVHIATSLAFGDHRTASELRRQQTADLPSITHCSQCHGRVLQCNETCAACGNPIWNYEWLNAD